MLIREILEGRFDSYTHRAIFLAGGAGAGKTHIARKLASVFYGLKIVNPDWALRMLFKQHNLSLKMPPEEEPKREPLRQYSKNVAGRQGAVYRREGLGMIIDTTGRIYGTIEGLKKELEDAGYRTAMLFVNADLETALRRNQSRERTVPEKFVKDNWELIRQNVGRYQRLFGENFFMVDNSDKNQSQLDSELSSVEKQIAKFLK